MSTVTLKQLFETHQHTLKLSWLTHYEEEHHPVLVQSHVSPSELIGYLNFVHPKPIPVLGEQEFNYLAKLSATAYQEALEQLLIKKPWLIIIADEQLASEEMLQFAQKYQTPLIASPKNAETIIENLAHYLTLRLAKSTTAHGVFMEVFDRGVLLTGESGVGKSELALELIHHGHRLVADDAPMFSKLAPDTLTGTCPPLLQDFLEVRGLGIINVRALFGHTAIKDKKQLHLIVKVVQVERETLKTMERLHPTQSSQALLGVEIPEVTLPAAPGRNLAFLVETAVRHQVLMLEGYNSFEIFAKRQREQLEEAST